MIRRARVEDARPVAELHVRTWQAAYRHVFPADALDAMDAEERVPRWEQNILNAEIPSWVAEQDGAVVGFAMVGPSRDPDCDGELYGIYVVPEAWGTPAGAGLMEAGLEYLRTHFREAVLWVLDDNPRARRFYERHGWQPDGATRTGHHLGVETAEVRYRISF